MSLFEPWSEERTVEIVNDHAHLEGPLMPILHAAQAVFGHVPEDAVPVIAREMNLSRAEVHGVVTFYHDFRQELAGKHVLKLCRAEACQSMGCERLVERAEDKLGVECGHTSADGRVTLEAVYCLGLCATAPSAIIDGRLVGRLDPAKLDAILKEAQA
ncbi:MAG: formate dehydrogenase subunit gamma [Hyphomicrobium sp.]|jgi:formate dehydrogenase subunit gamma